MLILSRKAGERVIVGPNVAVTIVEIQGDRVKLAFETPHGNPAANHLGAGESADRISTPAGESPYCATFA